MVAHNNTELTIHYLDSCDDTDVINKNKECNGKDIIIMLSSQKN